MIKFVKKIALVCGVVAVLLVIAAGSYLLTDKTSFGNSTGDGSVC